MDSPVKQQLHGFCEAYIKDRLSRIQKNIAALQEALNSETKSSAGDKHETGRAMIQLEREKLGKQLAEVQLLQELFKKVPLKGGNSTIALGNLVYSPVQNYYLAISAGELKVNGVSFYAIAPNTPIGKLLLGKGKGDVVVFNSREIKILEIQ